MLAFLRRHCSNSLPYEIQRKLYVSLVRSHLTYTSQVWAPTLLGPLNLMHTLEAVQRWATCYILYGLELDCKQHLLKLSLFPLSFFLEYLDPLFLFRCIKGEIHLDISDTIQFSCSSTHHGFTGPDIHLTVACTSAFLESYFVCVCPLWNALPLEICSLEWTSLFKSQSKALFTSHLTQSLDPWHIICPICRRPNPAPQCTC